MSNYRNIRQSIEDIASARAASEIVFTALAKSVSDTDCTIEVAGITLTGVKLYSIAAAGNLLVKPKENSTVTVMDMSRGKKRDLVVVKVDEPARVMINSNGFVVDFDCEAQKFDIKNNGASLKDFFETLIDIIKTLQVTVPGIGLSAVPFIGTQNTLALLKEQLNQLFK